MYGLGLPPFLQVGTEGEMKMQLEPCLAGYKHPSGGASLKDSGAENKLIGEPLD